MMQTGFEHETDYSDQHLTPCVSVSTSQASFPLTPALSSGERENRGSALDVSEALDLVESGNACLPLPKGEGWGEGEPGIPVATVPPPLKNCPNSSASRDGSRSA